MERHGQVYRDPFEKTKLTLRQIETRHCSESDKSGINLLKPETMASVACFFIIIFLKLSSNSFLHAAFYSLFLEGLLLGKAIGPPFAFQSIRLPLN